jgi:hypothetical protein
LLKTLKPGIAPTFAVQEEEIGSAQNPGQVRRLGAGTRIIAVIPGAGGKPRQVGGHRAPGFDQSGIPGDDRGVGYDHVAVMGHQVQIAAIVE